jgi:hypothetical protein
MHRRSQIWFDAPDDAARKATRADIQRAAPDEVACIPLGRHAAFTATRADLKDRVNGFALLWNLQRPCVERSMVFHRAVRHVARA